MLSPVTAARVNYIQERLKAAGVTHVAFSFNREAIRALGPDGAEEAARDACAALEAYLDNHDFDKHKWRAGLLFRPGSLWIGAHYSPTNRRWCINLLPMVTVWVCLPGGVRP